MDNYIEVQNVTEFEKEKNGNIVLPIVSVSIATISLVLIVMSYTGVIDLNIFRYVGNILSIISIIIGQLSFYIKSKAKVLSVIGISISVFSILFAFIITIYWCFIW